VLKFMVHQIVLLGVRCGSELLRDHFNDHWEKVSKLSQGGIPLDCSDYSHPLGVPQNSRLSMTENAFDLVAVSMLPQNFPPKTVYPKFQCETE
jgi:hypothetical protein